MSETRVRFAPSPTGFFHIGSARTALFNWLYARHCDGKFVLRIEDTDEARNTDEALDVLLKGMRWLGIDWDEGPEIGGEYGPYFQSQRGEIYQSYLEKLKSAGRTYEKDGAVFFKLEGERYTEYDSYHKAEIEKVKAAPVEIDDAIRGKVVRAEERDFVIFRSDGSPTFHFVNVVDDIEMKITHVIRGEDHLSNTSKHVELFKAFGAPVPQFAHMPLILKDPKIGKGKMSKRDKGALVEEYEDRHFLPSAVRNAIALLGWNPKDDREILDIGEIIEAFEIKDIQKGAARFDEKKMAFINAEYLRALPVESFSWFARPILTKAGVIEEDSDEDFLQKVFALCQEKVTSLEGLVDYCAYFFTDAFSFDEKTEKKVTKKGNAVELLDQVSDKLEGIEAVSWDESSLDSAFMELASENDQEKPFQWFPVTRFAISGKGGGPDFLPLLALLGKDCVLGRIQRFKARLA